jgi:hypothetical protein
MRPTPITGVVGPVTLNFAMSRGVRGDAPRPAFAPEISGSSDRPPFPRHEFEELGLLGPRGVMKHVFDNKKQTALRQRSYV